MPCSGFSHSTAVQVPQPSRPLFPSAHGCGPSTGPEKGQAGDTGADLHSKVGPVRYCLSSSEPAVGAGIWEEQTTRCVQIIQLQTPAQAVGL